MLENEVMGIIAFELDTSKKSLTLNSKFIDDLGADSINRIKLIMAFEDKYNLYITNEDAEKIVYVKDLVDYIRNKSVGSELEYST